MSDDLRRVLKDPAYRLPDSLVDLDAVHAGARRVQRRRTGLAALGGAAVVVALAAVVVHPWSGTDGSLPTASTGSTPSVVASPLSTPPVSPTPDPSGGIAANDRVLGVSAASDSTWWVLAASPATCLGRCGIALVQTIDGGATFTVVSHTGDADGIPAGTSDVRFLGGGVGYALRVGAPAGEQVWRTADGGRTWGPVSFPQRVLALEAGGGTGWLLVQDGRRIGVAAIASGLMENPRPTIWLGAGNGVHPALTVQGGAALVFWFTDAESRLSVVTSGGAVDERVDPCIRDLGSGSVSATAGGIAVSCHTGTLDTAYSSADGGRTWSALQDEQLGRLVVGSINGGLTSVGGQDGRLILWAADATRPTSTTGTDGTGAWTWIGFTSETSGFAIDETGQLFRTTDGGTAWAKVTFRP